MENAEKLPSRINFLECARTQSQATPLFQDQLFLPSLDTVLSDNATELNVINYTEASY